MYRFDTSHALLSTTQSRRMSVDDACKRLCLSNCCRGFEEVAMSRRGATLELAVLGLLHEQPMHGYELRKRLSGILGAFRVVSYGSLYPCLRTLSERGWITEHAEQTRGKRPRISYELTAEGKEQFQTLMDYAGPNTWEDDSFDVHFAFFGRASSDVRLRILEGRRSRLEERLDGAREQARLRRERTDRYTAELHRYGLEATEHEVRWLNELITAEREGSESKSTGMTTRAGIPSQSAAEDTEREVSESKTTDLSTGRRIPSQSATEDTEREVSESKTTDLSTGRRIPSQSATEDTELENNSPRTSSQTEDPTA
ncbi:helix-turn-helix transcriptional regulator [Yimella sp. cx-51]